MSNHSQKYHTFCYTFRHTFPDNILCLIYINVIYIYPILMHEINILMFHRNWSSTMVYIYFDMMCVCGVMYD